MHSIPYNIDFHLQDQIGSLLVTWEIFERNHMEYLITGRHSPGLQITIIVGQTAMVTGYVVLLENSEADQPVPLSQRSSAALGTSHHRLFSFDDAIPNLVDVTRSRAMRKH